MLAHVQRAGFEGLPIDAGRGIEIEHQAVGALRIVRSRAPWMEFERVHLYELDHAALVVDVKIVVAGAIFFLDRNRFDAAAERAGVVLLEKARAAGARRTAQQRERPLA